MSVHTKLVSVLKLITHIIPILRMTMYISVIINITPSRSQKCAGLDRKLQQIDICLTLTYPGVELFFLACNKRHLY